MVTADAKGSTALSSSSPRDSRFSCHICLEAVMEPVVTQCGHLYCWPCLYQWLEPGMLPEERLDLGLWSLDHDEGPIAPEGPTRSSSSSSNRRRRGLFGVDTHHQESRRQCPVCKAPCRVTTLVPIYVRNEEEEDDNDNERDNDDIDNDNDEEDHHEASDATPPTPPPPETHGLRRRLGRTTRTDGDTTDEAEARQPTVRGRRTHARGAGVPARPPASTPPRRHRQPTYQPEHGPGPSTMSSSSQSSSQHPQLVQHALRHSPSRSPSSMYVGSLARGMALYLHQQQQQQPTASSISSPVAASSTVPPLQRVMDHDGTFRTTTLAGEHSMAQEEAAALENPNATEVLSRLLLLLGSFVVLCLLLF